MKTIYGFEPWTFLFFGVFHLHRIWALIDRSSYAGFWLGVMGTKGPLYFLLTALLAGLSLLGIGVFFHERGRNFWWRWIYLLCGGYLLFDLFAIAVELPFWQRLLARMFDVNAPYWTPLWCGFILLGAVSFLLGLSLLIQRKQRTS